MNALLQLMALPAACMLFAWARHGGASGLARAVYRVVAMAAATGIGRMALAPCAGANPTSKTFGTQRVPTLPCTFRRAPKDGRIPRSQPLARTARGGRGAAARPPASGIGREPVMMGRARG